MVIYFFFQITHSYSVTDMKQYQVLIQWSVLSSRAEQDTKVTQSVYVIKWLETAVLLLHITWNCVRFKNNDFDGFALNLYVLKDNIPEQLSIHAYIDSSYPNDITQYYNKGSMQIK